MAGTGPCYMSLDLELLRVLTAGDAAALQELLRRREDQTSGHVAVNVQATAPTDALAAQPCPGTSCLLGVTSNGNTALHLVASRGHADLAALICERTPSLAATRNTFLDTPLHCAAREGHREAAACLVATMRAGGRAGELAAALRARNCLAATALYEAVRHRCAGVVELLMTEAPELASVETEDGSSPLYLAASIRSQELVRTLLRASPDGTPSPASFSGPEGRTALHAAAAATSHEMAQEILSWKPQGPTLLTRVDSTGRTPLQVAVMYGRLRTVQLFLDDITSAEQVRISDNHGLFPVHTAAIFPEEDAIRLMRNTKEYREFTWLKLKQLLLNGRATLIIDTLFKKCPGYYKMVDDKGRNLLHCAVEHNSYRLVRFICQKYTIATLLNGTDYEGNTPLHLAVKYGFIRIVSTLLETMSVDTNIVNKDGLTAGDLAAALYEYFPGCEGPDGEMGWLIKDERKVDKLLRLVSSLCPRKLHALPAP
nr:ankyrin repeat-containing protein At5g02620-like isoform X2 [Setaria viridis]